jgi:hypothetical protein
MDQMEELFFFFKPPIKNKNPTLFSAMNEFIFGLFFTSLAVCANLNVDNVSLLSAFDGLMQARKLRNEFELRESKKGGKL